MEYIAHINNKTKKIQTVEEHSINTAELSSSYAIDSLKDICYVLGLYHDIGKYQNAFQERIKGRDIKVEHSLCGAIEVREAFRKKTGRLLDPVSFLIQLCILGHHSGLPDCGNRTDTDESSTYFGRMKRKCDDEYKIYSNYIDTSRLDSLVDKGVGEFCKLLVADIEEKSENCKLLQIEKFAFLVRYCFSCLTDADSIDTMIACGERNSTGLKANFDICINRLDQKFNSFNNVTKLQRTRAVLQKQTFENIKQNNEIYLMNMPTGSGKTLASIKCAFTRLKLSNKKRIIYVIPFNSIVDQTYEQFEELFGDVCDIVRHQSSFSYEEGDNSDEDYRKMLMAATENWDAPIIITTAVQFFESLFANKRGKLRKVHNMADSIIVFDEAHLMPVKYLQPCLLSISFITKYLNSEAIFLTATMPDFESLLRKYALPNSDIAQLVTDKSQFNYFEKCNYHWIDSVSRENLIERISKYSSVLVVVNTRKEARDIFRLCTGEKYHLSTWMTAYDRTEIIARIKKSLRKLNEDFPNLEKVPDERRIVVVSTSLIEAGVDLDFQTVFRELSGLDNILQAGGRCNREGLRERGDVYIFSFDDSKNDKPNQSIMQGIFKEYNNISSQEAVESYYDRLFKFDSSEHIANTMGNKTNTICSIPFREYSESFKIIDDQRSVSIAVCRDDISRAMYDLLINSGQINYRKIRKYCCSVYLNEFECLLQQHVLNDYGSGVFFLTNDDYYDEAEGIMMQGKDIFL
jgi:CRISPR-associated endonuclease/helicase Cas3